MQVSPDRQKPDAKNLQAGEEKEEDEEDEDDVVPLTGPHVLAAEIDKE